MGAAPMKDIDHAHLLETFANTLDRGMYSETDRQLAVNAMRQAAARLRARPDDFVPEFLRKQETA